MANWYILADGQEIGPLESADLKRLAVAGRLKPTDKVRREDMTEWNAARQVKGADREYVRKHLSEEAKLAIENKFHASIAMIAGNPVYHRLNK